jgi:5-azacytidine-induced protein 1
MEEKNEQVVVKMKEGWAQELRRQREGWLAAEKVKRGQWMEAKTREVKEVTVKGLEQEVSER